MTGSPILRSAAAALKPGGVLVYSTCTTLPEENEGVIEAFLSDTQDFDRDVDPPQEVRDVVDDSGTLRCLPHTHDSDGFIAVRLRRR